MKSEFIRELIKATITGLNVALSDLVLLRTEYATRKQVEKVKAIDTAIEIIENEINREEKKL